MWRPDNEQARGEAMHTEAKGLVGDKHTVFESSEPVSMIRRQSGMISV